jgi:hypothetical protein
VAIEANIGGGWCREVAPEVMRLAGGDGSAKHAPASSHIRHPSCTVATPHKSIARIEDASAGPEPVGAEQGITGNELAAGILLLVAGKANLQI